jgi:hypothetical protein
VSNSELRWALDRLGLLPGDPPEAARLRYRELLRVSHPDVADSGVTPQEATEATVQITEAFRVVTLAIAEHGCIPFPETNPPASTGTVHDTCHHRGHPGPPDRIDAQVDGDTISMDLPAPEAFAVLLDAGSRIGGIGYVDRALGLLELIVRFEGGPSCSVLITLQGRAFGTDAFVTMESIEAAPTPPIEPVMSALLEEIEALRIA